MVHDVRRCITWNWLWWREIRCRGEGHEEWEGTWEGEMKEWQLGTIMYIDDITGPTEEVETELILPF